MTSTKRILDLYCGAGGVAAGLRRAFPDAVIVGVDNQLQPRYPEEFYQADAVAFGELFGRQFDFIWASPPCQHYTAGRRAQRLNGSNPHPDLIARTRQAVQASGRPYIIENVEGAPLRDPVRLCGQMFDLRVVRHRLFESNFSLVTPAHSKHTGSMLDGSIVAVYGNKRFVSGTALKGETSYHMYGKIPLEFRRIEAQRAAMGISWMTGKELKEAIPPVYASYLAGQISI
jgi:DNA (cytosine-5)-methyltransferase 1